MKLRWLAVLAPFAAGLALDLILYFTAPAIPVMFLRADIGSLALLVGAGISGIIAGAIYVSERYNRLQRQKIAEMNENFNDERRRFLRRLDHELKNPLTAIRAGLVNLHDSQDGQFENETLCSVETQALRLSRLAADLRKIAELETRSLERTPVDLSATLQEAFQMAQDRPEASERNFTLTLPHAPWPLPTISGDEDLLLLAVHNLLDNAVKFTRSGDTVEVRAFEDGQSVVIEIADTGPGIPEEEMPHVWEELYRGQGARGVPGSGLGLALVRAIAERHNGSVNLRSRSGKGTVFSLRLPVG
ncbi:MAG: sensor histidine kinase [Chloroflexi bacterium]|nr:MAG: sensor histidine kinase [Chloroflexota bacterium]